MNLYEPRFKKLMEDVKYVWEHFEECGRHEFRN